MTDSEVGRTGQARKYFLDTEFIESGAGVSVDLLSIGIVCEDGREFYAESASANLAMANTWVEENVLPHLTGEKQLLGPIGEQIKAFVGADKPEFWGYYADYDWVVFCQIFGTMLDLPKGWPMYCRDIKQLCDSVGNPKLPEQSSTEHNALNDARWNRDAYNFLAAALPEGAEPPQPSFNSRLKTACLELAKKLFGDPKGIVGHKIFNELKSRMNFVAELSPLPSAAPFKPIPGHGLTTSLCNMLTQSFDIPISVEVARAIERLVGQFESALPAPGATNKTEREILRQIASKLCSCCSIDGDPKLANVDDAEWTHHYDDGSTIKCDCQDIWDMISALPASPGAQPPSDQLSEPATIEDWKESALLWKAYAKKIEYSRKWQAERTSAVAPVNEWQRAIEDACACLHLNVDSNDPRKSLQTLISWEVKIALDPEVSEATQDLINQGSAVAPGTSEEKS